MIMNILIGATQLNKPNGGVSTHVVDLCKYLINTGNNVVVTSKGGEYVEQIEKLGIKHYEIPFDGIQKRPMEMLKAYIKFSNFAFLLFCIASYNLSVFFSLNNGKRSIISRDKS